MNRTKFIIFCFAVAGVIACRKNTASVLDIRGTSGTTGLKIVHASAYAINNPVQLKVNNERLSNNITYTTPFPGGGLNTGGSNFPYYLSVSSGPTYISMSLPKAGSNDDSVVLTSKTITTESDRYYTAYLTDTTTKTELILVTENTELPADNTSRFKFINLIPNLASADLYLNSTKVASGIAYKSVSSEFVLPRGGTAVWAIRPAGAAPTSTALATYTQSGGIPNNRIMTVYSRGYNTATGTRAPAVSLLYN